MSDGEEEEEKEGKGVAEGREEEVKNGTKRGNRSLLHAVRNSSSFRPLFFLASFLPSGLGGNKRQITETPVM